MTECDECGQELAPTDRCSALRQGTAWYHLACAPRELVATAFEEHQAILRKGIRYFVEKYSAAPADALQLGATFVDLGRALEAERARRGGGA